MSNRPTFVNNNTQMECIRSASGQPLKLKLACWINPKKSDKFDEQKIAACDTIRDLVIKYDLQFNVKFNQSVDDDYKNDKLLGSVNIFANKPYEERQDNNDVPFEPSSGGGFGGGFSNA